jgi:hypothetical protein
VKEQGSQLASDPLPYQVKPWLGPWTMMLQVSAWKLSFSVDFEKAPRRKSIILLNYCLGHYPLLKMVDGFSLLSLCLSLPTFKNYTHFLGLIT